MPAAYDTFDYPSYWKTRDYEHISEVIALSNFLKNIKHSELTIDIGGGFGRLTPYYRSHAKEIILSDPSAKLLKLAKKRIKSDNIQFKHASFDKLPKKIKKNSADLVLLIRVLHHIDNPKEVIEVACQLLKKNGHFIIEFANKRHLKAAITEFFRGNFTFILDIFPKDIRSKSSKKKKTIPFFNYHPDKIRDILKNCGFQIIEERSVSNIRLPIIKKIVPLKIQLLIERVLQKPFAKYCLGPSIFILAQKRDDA